MNVRFGTRHVPGAPPSAESGAQWLLRRISTANPFYVVSALLVFIGLRVSFGPESGHAAQPGALALGLAGYVLLLAITAGLLVRLGNVWEDVRTVLLLVVFFLLTVSTAFDGILASNWTRGALCDLAGWAFAVVVSEVLLRGTRLRLPLLFRVPYHLILALFFVYPIALGPLLPNPRSAALQWGLFGFSATAGLAFLALLPAIRRGPLYVKAASPWRWPMYPWSLFVFLGVAVCLRAWYLCETMHHPAFPNARSSIFGLYFLAPFLLTLCALVLEVGFASGSQTTIRLAVTAPLGLIVLSGVGHRSDAVYTRFIELFQGALGATPLFVVLVAAIAFQAFAACRRAPGARSAVLASLAMLCWVAPGSVNLDLWTSPRPWPAGALGLLLMGLGWRRNESWQMIAGALCVQTALWIGLAGFSPASRAWICAHSMIALALGIGVVREGSVARLCRAGGLLALGGLGLATTRGFGGGASLMSADVLKLYPLNTASLALLYGVWANARASSRASAAVSLGSMISSTGGRVYQALRASISGLDQIALGLVFLVLAAAVSLAKTGILKSWLARTARELFWPPHEPADAA
jgi:hypothetical protein